MNGFVEGEEDLSALPGTNFEWNYQIEGLDFTGATGIMRTEVLGDLPLTLSDTNIGVNEFGTLNANIAATTTSSWLPGVYRFRVLVTFSDGSVLDCVTGTILVETP